MNFFVYENISHRTPSQIIQKALLS
jgi:hypothetical protein